MCGCNMMNDGIDMDVLKALPGKFIKKIAYHSNVPMDSYNDALKQAIKAKAKSSSTNVRSFLTGIPGVEAEIIKIEKMKEGGNLYAPYPKKAQGPFGPKYVDSKTMLSTYAEQQDKKTKEQYRTDLLRPMMQEGGSILNDIGKEHLIVPRTQGTELNIPKYIQAYVQATTNMGKYQSGGALQAMGGIGGISKMATDLSSAFKKKEEPRDPNEPPLTRFSNGGVSEAMNFYITNYPGYKEGMKGRFQDGGKIVLQGVTLTDEQAKAYNTLKSKYNGSVKVVLGNEGETSGRSLPGLTYQEGSKSLDFYDSEGDYLGSISYDSKQTQKPTIVTSVNMPKKEQAVTPKSIKEAQLQKEKEWLQNNPLYGNSKPNQTLVKTGDFSLWRDNDESLEHYKTLSDNLISTKLQLDPIFKAATQAVHKFPGGSSFITTIPHTGKGESNYRKRQEESAATRKQEDENWKNQKPYSGYKGTDVVAGVKLTPDQLYKIEDFLGGRKKSETVGDVISRGEFMRKGTDVIQVSNNGQTLDITYTPQQDIEGAKWLNENKPNKVTGKSTAQPLKKLKSIKSTDVSNLQTVTKGGQEYKIDTTTGRAYTTDGKTITDKTFAKNILAEAPGKQIKIVEPTKVDLQAQASEDLENRVVPTGVYNQNLMETKVKQSLNKQIPSIEDTRSQGRRVLDKTKTKLVDFFTRTEEEKEEKRKRRLNRK